MIELDHYLFKRNNSYSTIFSSNWRGNNTKKRKRFNNNYIGCNRLYECRNEVKKQHDIDVEVVDLRSLKPLDNKIIFKSLKKQAD